MAWGLNRCRSETWKRREWTPPNIVGSFVILCCQASYSWYMEEALLWIKYMLCGTVLCWEIQLTNWAINENFHGCGWSSATLQAAEHPRVC